ncbi:MAG: T9SS type A sorting domain-containing protein [Flavobacteriales bacterium]|nr:T9SS type A sorting domain-containing protein [Flavobacteriales bacterium]
MMKPYALMAAMALTTTLTAQNWTVGVPVNMQVSEIAVNGGGCSPGPQATLYLDHPAVDGITYYYEVTSIVNGVYTMVPGPAGILMVGDTIHVPANFITTVFNQQAAGSLQMRVIAAGTPTTAGQVHPCTASMFWMSNLMLCNEGLSTTLSSGCTVQPGSTQGIADLAGSNAWFSNNGTSIRLTDASIRTAQLVDAQGRVVATTNNSGGMLELGTLPTGMYVVRAQRADGSVLSERVMLAH